MKTEEWMGVIIIYALLYLLNRIVSFVSLSAGFFYGDIVLMIVILFISWCIAGKDSKISFEQRSIAKRDKKLTKGEKLE